MAKKSTPIVKAPAAPASTDFTFNNPNMRAVIRFNPAQVLIVTLDPDTLSLSATMVDEVAETTKTGTLTLS